MKKFTAILLSISLCTLISMLATNPAQAIELKELTWFPPYLEKDANVVIYRDGASVDLKVPVKNNAGIYPDGLNVSKVIISFDTGQNKTLDLSANIKQLANEETWMFTISFTASAAEAVSSDWEHEYDIYVEHVNATTGPTEIVDTWPQPMKWSWPLFVVFPTDQADAYDLSKEYDAYEDAPWSFHNVNASHLVGQASIEASLGETYYGRGDYASAETQYQTALDLYSQALAAEMEWGTRSDEADLDIKLTEADANMAMANAALRQADATVTQAISWILFGVGFVFMGIATIVYAYRKPKVG